MLFIRFILAETPIVNVKGLPTPKDGIITVVVNLVFGVVASIAVLMIVVNGFRYIAAHGDSNATAQARNGILYALVGLIVTMAAFSIVTFAVRGIG